MALGSLQQQQQQHQQQPLSSSAALVETESESKREHPRSSSKSDSKTPTKPMRCLTKNLGCKSRDCVTALECTDPVASTHCFAITNRALMQTIQSAKLNTNTTSNSASSDPHAYLDAILAAGCWRGGDECQPPASLAIMNSTHNFTFGDPANSAHVNLAEMSQGMFRVADALLDPAIQHKCFVYAIRDTTGNHPQHLQPLNNATTIATSSSSSSFDQSSAADSGDNSPTLCCCATPMCNNEIHVTNEHNPFDFIMSHPPMPTNAPPPLHSPGGMSTPRSVQQAANGGSDLDHLAAAQHSYSAVMFVTLLLSCVSLVVILVLAALYVRRVVLMRAKRHKAASALAAESGNANGNHHLHHNHHHHHHNNHNNKHSPPLPPATTTVLFTKFTNNNNDNNNSANKMSIGSNTNRFVRELAAANADQELLQPLMFASPIVAPNVQLPSALSSSIAPAPANATPTQAQATMPRPMQFSFPMPMPMPMPMGKPPQSALDFVRQLNELGDLDAGSGSGASGASTEPYTNSSNALQHVRPSQICSGDLRLVELIAQGHFSSVWRAHCPSSILDANDDYGDDANKEKTREDEPVKTRYAVKIFTGQQKSAWLNERSIYHAMATTHPNILKYYGCDTHAKSESTGGDAAFHHHHDPFGISDTLEYWLIGEYHECGSLSDYLRTRRLSWPQMVCMCHSILEGLSYLHGEQRAEASADGGGGRKKTFAIAHRDLKSKNVLVRSDGRSCCIGDFGLALRLTSSSSQFNSAEIRSKVGTRRYMSPELIEGAIAFTKETFLSERPSFKLPNNVGTLLNI